MSIQARLGSDRTTPLERRTGGNESEALILVYKVFVVSLILSAFFGRKSGAFNISFNVSGLICV